MLRQLLPAAVLLAIAWGTSACAEGVAMDPGPAVDDVIGGPAQNASPARDGLGGSTATTKRGTDPTPGTTGGPLFRAAADSPLPSASLNTFTRYEAALQSDGTLTIAQGKGVNGTDPQPTDYHGGSFYNGGSYRHAGVVSPIWKTATPFNRVTPSFEASTPPGTWLEVKVSAHIASTNSWTKEYSLGVWAYDDTTVRRHSVSEQADADGDVATDTLVLSSPADELFVGVILFSDDPAISPVIRAVSAIATTTEKPEATTAADPKLWGKTLDVPKHSQMIYPDGGAGWDSATSTTMLLGFWGITGAPPDAAKLCHDLVEGSAGNQPFNTAYAAAIDGGKMHSLVTSLASFAQVEPLVGAGVPVAIGVAYGSGELAGAPIASTSGHVLVVKGFDASGNVVVNDPGFATDATVETIYDRAQLTAAWRRSGGTTYVVWPVTKQLPADPLGAY